MQCLGRWRTSASAKRPSSSASASTRCAAGTATASSRRPATPTTAAAFRSAEVERLRTAPERHRTGDELSTRNRFPGRVVSVEVDGVMALVEIEAGPHRVTAAITRDSVEELGLAEGVEATALVKATSVMIQRDSGLNAMRHPSSPRSSSRLRSSPAAAAPAIRPMRRSRSSSSSRASSLGPAFEQYGDEFDGADVKFSFAGSDDLAAQIRQGVTPDVYAAANTSLPDELHKDGLLEKPTTFVTNKLVIGVPAGSEIDDVADLEQPGVKVAIGDEDVPVGIYTREVLDGARAGRRTRRSSPTSPAASPTSPGSSASSTQGAVDAGFVYRSDVDAAGGSDRGGRRSPPSASPDVAYGIAVTTDAAQPELAQQFVDGVVSGDGQEILLDSGFGPPPGSSDGRLDRLSDPRRRGAGAAARLPGPAADRAVRRDRSRRARLQPRRARRRRGALAEPADLAGGARDHRRGRHPGRLADRAARLPRPRRA